MNKEQIVVVNNVKYLIKNSKDIIENTLAKGNQWNNDILLLIGLLIKKYNYIYWQARYKRKNKEGTKKNNPI